MLRGFQEALVFALVVALGLGLGLYVAWEVWPQGRPSEEPADLRWEYKEEYVIMIAEAYSRYGDLARAEERLTFLGLSEPAEVIKGLLEGEGGSAASLTQLAYALGVRDASWAAYMPTPTPISMSPASEGSFRLEGVEDLGCGDFDEDIIMVCVRDANGLGISGVELRVLGPQGEDLFYTGLKPEVNPGYADFTVEEPGEYRVEVAQGSSPVAEIGATLCPQEGGHHAWRVTFEKINE